MKTLPALLLAAAGVGFGHAVMPDHWMPLAVLSRTRRYSTRRTVRLALAAGVTHVLVSLFLGAVLVVVGMQFRDTVARHTDVVIGGILLVTGLVFLVMELVGRGHGHSHDGDGHSQGSHGHGHDHERGHDREHEHSHEREHSHHPHDHENAHAHAHAVATLERPEVQVETHAERRPEHRPRRDPHGLAAFLVPFGTAASPDLTILPVFLAAGAVSVGASVGALVAFAVATVATVVGLTAATAAGARLPTASWIDRGANLLTAGTLLLIGALVASGVI